MIINLTMDNLEKLQETKKAAEAFYENIGSVPCPYLKRSIVFNVKGLDHIKMKAWNKTRLSSDQYLRLKFLKLVPDVLRVAGTLQELLETNCMERLKFTGKWQHKMVSVKYYGFIAIINGIKIKIIIKEIEGVPPYFWSVIPFWKTKNNEIFGEIKKVFHEGDLEND
ncbi:MAG: hypothetical protein V1892_01310 [bacterium]